MKKVTFKKDFIMAEMYEDFRKMRIERKIDKILDSVSELSYSMISGKPGSGAGSGIKGRPISSAKPSSGAGTGIRGAGYPLPRRSEDMDNEPEDDESFIEDNPPDTGKEDLAVSSRPYDHPIKAGSKLSIEQIFPGFIHGDFTNNDGIESIAKKVQNPDEDENEEWQDSEYDEGPAEEDNDQKLENDINTVPNQNADELYDDIKDEMLGEMIDNVLKEEERGEEYKKYFDSMLSKYGVSSIGELDEEKKKEFFTAVNKGWKSKEEAAG